MTSLILIVYLSIAAEVIYFTVNCEEKNKSKLARDLVRKVSLLSLPLTGIPFIIKLKTQRRNIWNETKSFTLVLLIVTELVMILKVTPLFNYFTTGSSPIVEGFTNRRFVWVHIDRVFYFIAEDLILCYVWIFYRINIDIFKLYGDISKI